MKCLHYCAGFVVSGYGLHVLSRVSLRSTKILLCKEKKNNKMESFTETFNLSKVKQVISGNL